MLAKCKTSAKILVHHQRYGWYKLWDIVSAEEKLCPYNMIAVML